MAFVIPQFPLVCRLYTGRVINVAPRLSDVPCNLAYGRRVSFSAPNAVGIQTADYAAGSHLLLPLLTDIRDPFNSSGPDAIECPQGSGRFYYAVYVDDVGKGFANEHRLAVIAKQGNSLGFWPTPIP